MTRKNQSIAPRCARVHRRIIAWIDTFFFPNVSEKQHQK